MELIVVIAVIGILAAITIVSYSAVQSNSKDSVVQTELSNFASKANVSKAETGGNGIHDPTTADFLETLKWTATKSAYDTSLSMNLAYCHNRVNAASTTPSDAPWATNANGRTNWALVAQSKSGRIFYVTSSRAIAAEHTGNAIVFNSSTTICGSVITALGTPGFSGVYHGYAAADTTTGPWRTWAGGGS